jgi:hypothetical protein
MRKRIYNWQGQRFAYIWMEGEPGQSLEMQSQGLFDRAGPALASLGLTLDKNVVRTRVYGRTRDARNIVSAARGRAFSGQARAATSSFISPDHLDWYSDVALELWAMAAPTDGAPRKVTEMEPVAVFIRHLVWGPLVFHAGMTNDEFPTLKEQCAETRKCRDRAGRGLFNARQARRDRGDGKAVTIAGSNACLLAAHARRGSNVAALARYTGSRNVPAQNASMPAIVVSIGTKG